MVVKKMFCVLLVLSLMVSLAACGGSEPSKPAAGGSGEVTFENGPSFNLKFGHAQSSTHPYHLGALYMAEQLEKRSNGKIKMEVFPSNQLGAERDLAEGAQIGTVDFACLGSAVMANFDPSWTIYDLPYLFESRDHAYKVLDGEFGKGRLKNIEKVGLIGLGYFCNGFFDIMNGKREIKNPEDLKGLNIRTMENAVYMAAIKALGGNPVPMAFSEVVTSLQNGTIDGLCLSINGIYASKIHTVQKYFTNGGMVYSPIPLIMSKKTYDAMPPVYQKLVTEVAAEAVKFERDETIRQENVNLEAMKKEGITVSEPADKKAWMDLLVKSVYSQFPDKIKQEDIDKVKAGK